MNNTAIWARLYETCTFMKSRLTRIIKMRFSVRLLRWNFQLITAQLSCLQSWETVLMSSWKELQRKVDNLFIKTHSWFSTSSMRAKASSPRDSTFSARHRWRWLSLWPCLGIKTLTSISTYLSKGTARSALMTSMLTAWPMERARTTLLVTRLERKTATNLQQTTSQWLKTETKLLWERENHRMGMTNSSSSLSEACQTNHRILAGRTLAADEPRHTNRKTMTRFKPRSNEGLQKWFQSKRETVSS